jgi:hypothetical protein
MTDALTPDRSGEARPHLRLVSSQDPEMATLMAMINRLSPAHRRVLAAAMARVGEIDDDEREAEACALIDQVIAVIRRR